MVCADDISLRRHRKLGMCTHDNCNEQDIGLQTRHSMHDRLLGSWHHQRFIPFCLRWKHKVERLGLMFLLFVLLLVVLVIWVSQMVLAEFTTMDSFLFASIGDFGSGTKTQERVAYQVSSSLSPILKLPFSAYIACITYELMTDGLERCNYLKSFQSPKSHKLWMHTSGNYVSMWLLKHIRFFMGADGNLCCRAPNQICDRPG